MTATTRTTAREVLAGLAAPKWRRHIGRESEGEDTPMPTRTTAEAYANAEAAALVVKIARKWRWHIGRESEGTESYNRDARRLMDAVDTYERLQEGRV